MDTQKGKDTMEIKIYDYEICSVPGFEFPKKAIAYKEGLVFHEIHGNTHEKQSFNTLLLHACVSVVELVYLYKYINKGANRYQKVVGQNGAGQGISGFIRQLLPRTYS